MVDAYSQRNIEYGGNMGKWVVIVIGDTKEVKVQRVEGDTKENDINCLDVGGIKGNGLLEGDPHH